MLPLISIPQTSLRLSAMCLGNSAFGTGLPKSHTDQVYAAFREAGGNCFDTAHCYCFWLPNGQGSSERALGECIRRHGDSGNIFIMTKGGHPAVPPDYQRSEKYLSPEVIASDIADSLERLGVETIDLFFLHRDDTRVPVEEIMTCLNDHIAAGRIGSIGASNWSFERMNDANTYAETAKLHGFVASQPQFSFACPNAPVPTSDPTMRFLRTPDIAWHTSSGLPVICYSPTANGYFASRGQRGQSAYDNAISRSRLERATQLAKRMNVTAQQIALAYLRCLPFPVIPILGTTDLEHLREAIAAAAIDISPGALRWLETGANEQS